MRGTDIDEVVEMVKGELMLDASSEISPGGDATLKRQVSTMQKWLAIRCDWEFLYSDKTVNLTPGVAVYQFPTSGAPATLHFELGRPMRVECYSSLEWTTVDYGIISVEQYNTFNTALDQRCDPVRRWAFNDYAANDLRFEVWPLPETAGQIKFHGQRKLARFTTSGDLCDLDDVLIMQYTAAKLAARMKNADAAALLAQAQETYKELRRGYPSETYGFDTTDTGEEPRKSERPIIATMINP